MQSEVERWQREGLMRNVSTDGDGKTPSRSLRNLQLIPLYPVSPLFAALPLVGWRGGHVTITLTDRWFAGAAARIRDRLVAVVAAAVAGVMAWRLAVLAGRLGDYGDQFEFIGIPRAAIAWPVSVLCGLSALALLARAVLPRES